MDQGKSKSIDYLDPELMKRIIRHIEGNDVSEPDSIQGAPYKTLGRVIELEREFLVVMPPNLALRMPKKAGSTLDSVRDQIISMVGMHVKVRDTETG